MHMIGGKQRISNRAPCYYVAAGDAVVSLKWKKALIQKQAGDDEKKQNKLWLAVKASEAFSADNKQTQNSKDNI